MLMRSEAYFKSKKMVYIYVQHRKVLQNKFKSRKILNSSHCYLWRKKSWMKKSGLKNDGASYQHSFLHFFLDCTGYPSYLHHLELLSSLHPHGLELLLA
jgi:hypothetical protein